MPDFSRLTLRAEYAENSAFTSPLVDRSYPAYSITTPTHWASEKVVALTAGNGTAYNVLKFAASRQFIVVNRDATNFVTVRYYTLGGGAQVQTSRVYPGGFLAISDLDPTRNSGVIELDADVANALCEVFVTGT